MMNFTNYKPILFKMMKLSFVQVCISLFLTGMSYAYEAKAQEILDREVTVQLSNKDLETVLSKIEQSANVRFVFSSKLISSNRLVTVNARQEKLAKVLQNILSPMKIGYEVSGNKIILNRAIDTKADVNPNAKAAIEGISGKVKSKSGEAIPGVSVVVKGTKRGTITDANGEFKINANKGDVLVFSFIGYNSSEARVGDGDVMNITLEESTSTLAEVSVVGSRSTQLRTSTETVVPVDVITSKDLQLTGQIEPTQQIQFTAPSFVSNRQSVADGTDHIDPASLRGLGPDQVLVLVNGKRRYNTALVNINGTVGKGSVGTDLNAIPASAIERIEVLRDGAASQYGSDAIAGVINIVLKKQVGTTISTQIGQHYEGDGRNIQFGVNHGMKLGKGILSLTLDYRNRDSTNRAGTFLGTVYNANATQDAALIAANGGWDRENNMQVGNSKQQNIQLAANLEMPVGAGKTKFYLNGMYGNRTGRAAGFYRYPKQTSQVVASLYPKGFLPFIESTINDKSVMAGLKGEFAKGWNWDLSSTYGGNSFRFDITNSNNASMGASSPKEFYAGTIKFNQSTTNFDVAKDFGKKMGLESFNLALGAEYRIDNFIIEAGDEASWKNYAPASGKVGGAQVFPGYQPENALNETRGVMGVYADIETDLSKKLLLSTAGRFENYSDFGNAFAGKLALRYKFADAFSVRGSVSNGFRAPSLHQYFFNNTSTQFQVINGETVPSNTLTVRNNSTIAKALGIDELTPEKSTNMELG